MCVVCEVVDEFDCRYARTGECEVGGLVRNSCVLVPAAGLMISK